MLNSKPILKSFSTLGKRFAASQEATFSQELILVDSTDKYLGPVNKKDAHLNLFNATSQPHRAFSVFLFDQNNNLLLQKRSSDKITFPNYWTNSCCSHPLHISSHLNPEKDTGIKLSAVERVKFELGIELKGIQELNLLDKILYESSYDEIWGEKELDYVFFVRKSMESQEADNYNRDEIGEIAWVNITNIKEFLQTKETAGEPTTPWMKLILSYKLLDWWEKFSKGELITGESKIKSFM